MLIAHNTQYMYIIVAILDQIVVNTRQTRCYRYDNNNNNDIDGEASIQVPKYQIRTKEGESQPGQSFIVNNHHIRPVPGIHQTTIGRTERVRGQTGNA